MDEITGAPDWGRLAWPRTTERLTLRPATADDAEAMFAYRSLPSVARWMTQLPSDLESWRVDFHKRHPFALMVLLDDAPIGDLFLKTEDAWAQAEVRERASNVFAEIGWCLAPDHEGHGLATEAVRDLLAIAFAGLGLRRVMATCFADNEPSWRLMERLGMRRESHTVRDALHRDGEWYDGLTYALLADEWSPDGTHP
ncbi:Protein N-acetyltransferase, RimJ/RimL family [Nocardioides alpinus]|uniref:N-acetyltransferase n=1 Tax=Nocardioides alpinus TaxID=748909 RepID=A0A1I0ZLE3_9ACTN|nr:GNAT family protein [Nocardioides alpinus]PKH41966.1 N-acetyltransferase [Nocardioides alpinus]SFB26172.1 Protein N-acetyltransferase, RimJ/RimL family [Nocardioides alpinus]